MECIEKGDIVKIISGKHARHCGVVIHIFFKNRSEGKASIVLNLKETTGFRYFYRCHEKEILLI